ncbi:MAG: hypothetical protein BWY71_01201 [Planctomycetes bacterium ADurb.Bin412]|nr:MAG: hypothetical protein BWY71_01201 [Planctomycetes bacterium ADurb.Bin412]
MVDCPLASKTPTTWQETLPSRILFPIGSWLPNNFLTTVAPTMQTALPVLSSLSKNWRPFSTGQFRTVKNAFVLPVAVVIQFSLPRTAVTACEQEGATAAIWLISRPIASASAISKGEEFDDCPGPCRLPGITKSIFVPILAICSVTWAVVPLPIVTSVITAATPIIMPRIVNTERITFRLISRTASKIVFNSIRIRSHC